MRHISAHSTDLANREAILDTGHWKSDLALSQKWSCNLVGFIIAAAFGLGVLWQSAIKFQVIVKQATDAVAVACCLQPELSGQKIKSSYVEVTLIKLPQSRGSLTAAGNSRCPAWDWYKANPTTRQDKTSQARTNKKTTATAMTTADDRKRRESQVELSVNCMLGTGRGDSRRTRQTMLMIIITQH